MPFYSRRIGLYQGSEVPILWGGKVNGKVKNTHFGILIWESYRVFFAPLGDLYIVYKHNIQPDLVDRWQQDQNQLIVK